jgi:hypothetical protein
MKSRLLIDYRAQQFSVNSLVPRGALNKRRGNGLGHGIAFRLRRFERRAGFNHYLSPWFQPRSRALRLLLRGPALLFHSGTLQLGGSLGGTDRGGKDKNPLHAYQIGNSV